MPEDQYHRIAGVYDRIFEPLTRGLRLVGLGMFEPERGMAILDVGCGTGLHLALYRRYGCELFGIDASAAMLQAARSRLGDGADLREADATRIPHEDGTFDLVICMLSLHEMEEATRHAVIAEIKRVLKSDGRVLLIDFHVGWARPLRGWLSKLAIFVSEIAAGRRHFRNYRHFISTRGLATLISGGGLVIDKEKVVAGGTFALYLLRAR